MSNINKLVFEAFNDPNKLFPIEEVSKGAGLLAAGGITGMAIAGSKLATGIKKAAGAAAAIHRKKLELAGN